MDQTVEPISTYFSPATSFPTVSSLLTVLLKNVMVVAGIIGFLAIVIGGFKIIQAAGKGESDGVAKQKDAITATVIGIILIVAAYWIVQIVEYITGVPIFEGVEF